MSAALATQVEPAAESVPVVESRGKAVTMPAPEPPWMSATAYTVLPSGLTVTAPTWKRPSSHVVQVDRLAFERQPSVPDFCVSAPVVVLRSKLMSVLLELATA